MPLPMVIDCCCECFEFIDVFDRPDSTDLGINYDTCGSSWGIEDMDAVGSGSFVLLKSIGRPYGWLFTCFKFIPDVTYRVSLYKGTEDFPCSGTTALNVEIVMTDNMVTVEILGSGLGKLICTHEEEGDPEHLCLLVCLGKDGLIVGRPPNDEGWVCEPEFEEVLDPLYYCDIEMPSGLYFELSASGAEDGVIHSLWYQEHRDFENDPECPRCQLGTCFGYEDAIIGYEVTINNITNNACEECPSQLSAIIYLAEGFTPCQNPPIGGEWGMVTECPGPLSPGGDPQPAYATLSWELDCDEEGYTLTINGNIDSMTVQAGPTITRFFPKPIDSSDILISEEPPDNLAELEAACGGEFPASNCCFENSTITATPITQEGCCYNPINPSSTMEGMSFPSHIPRLIDRLMAPIVKAVEWISKPEEKGLGDTTERLLGYVGGNVVKKVIRSTNRDGDCGCSTRKKFLNKRYPYRAKVERKERRKRDSKTQSFTTQRNDIFRRVKRRRK